MFLYWMNKKIYYSDRFNQKNNNKIYKFNNNKINNKINNKEI